MKIAIYGLSADPFHNGHFEIIKRLFTGYYDNKCVNI